MRGISESLALGEGISESSANENDGITMYCMEILKLDTVGRHFRRKEIRYA